MFPDWIRTAGRRIPVLTKLRPKRPFAGLEVRVRESRHIPQATRSGPGLECHPVELVLVAGAGPLEDRRERKVVVRPRIPQLDEHLRIIRMPAQDGRHPLPDLVELPLAQQQARGEHLHL